MIPLTTVGDLESVSLGNLGKMTQGTKYHDFMLKALRELGDRNITVPRLIAVMKVKPEMRNPEFDFIQNRALSAPVQQESQVVLYAISAFEWPLLLLDARTLLEEPPEIHVVDKRRYTTLLYFSGD